MSSEIYLFYGARLSMSAVNEQEVKDSAVLNCSSLRGHRLRQSMLFGWSRYALKDDGTGVLQLIARHL
jgi:hypothetical protein